MEEFEKSETARATREILRAVNFGLACVWMLLGGGMIVLSIVGIASPPAFQIVCGLLFAVWLALYMAITHLEPSRK